MSLTFTAIKIWSLCGGCRGAAESACSMTRPARIKSLDVAAVGARGMISSAPKAAAVASIAAAVSCPTDPRDSTGVTTLGGSYAGLQWKLAASLFVSIGLKSRGAVVGFTMKYVTATTDANT